jgi:hypothetical protein
MSLRWSVLAKPGAVLLLPALRLGSVPFRARFLIDVALDSHRPIR